MRHIVIGGSGFIGNFLVKKLIEQDKEVIVCDLIRPKIACEFKKVDIRKEGEVREIGFEKGDIIYHLASHIYDCKVPRFGVRQYFYETNVAGTKNILNAMYETGCKKMIYFSTDKVYGIPKTIPIKETHIKKPIGPYGVSKLEAERLCEEYRKKGIKTTIFRLPIVMGPGRTGIFNKVFYLIWRGLPLPLIGGGNSRYHMLSVHDCVEAVIQASKKMKNNVFNIGSDAPMTQRKLLEGLIEAIHSNSRIISVNAKLAKFGLGVLEALHVPVMHKEQYMLIDRDCVLDTSKAKNRLKWQPKHTESTAILEAFKHYMRFHKK